jgi:succinate dehydrogenase / fumarate reductase flavoprotein subunit
VDTNVLLSTNAKGSNVTAASKIHKQGYLVNPCLHKYNPTCIPVHEPIKQKLTLMSESLVIQGEFGYQKRKKDAAIREGRLKSQLAEEDRDFTFFAENILLWKLSS